MISPLFLCFWGGDGSGMVVEWWGGGMVEWWSGGVVEWWWSDGGVLVEWWWRGGGGVAQCR